MGQAVFSFLGYLVLQLFVLAAGMNMVREERIGFSGLLKSWVMGQMLLFALLQVMAVPMILLKWKFSALLWSYLGACAVLSGSGLMRLAKRKKVSLKMDRQAFSVLAVLLLVFAAGLILWQAGTYFFGIHLDEDDARWLAEANDALEYGHMMTCDYDTGEYLGTFTMIKDVTSPWPMMYAVCSRILRIRASVFAHTIYPPAALLTMYAVYWLMASELFEKTEARLAFLFFAALINLFLGITVFTQQTFSLVRIWQGKATVAAIVIPLLLWLFIRINKRDENRDWFSLPVVCCAACLMSGMGISIAAVMTAVYGGYHIIAYRHWKRIPHAVLAVLPSVVSLAVYLMFRPLF